jgi:rubrerythrin
MLKSQWLRNERFAMMVAAEEYEAKKVKEKLDKLFNELDCAGIVCLVKEIRGWSIWAANVEIHHFDTYENAEYFIKQAGYMIGGGSYECSEIIRG